MEDTGGVYVMQVASILSGMHPQTLRKYERAGFLTPSRSNTLRMYSDEDIARLRMIRHLVNKEGLNLAGVNLALKLQDSILDIKEELVSVGISHKVKHRLEGLLNELLGLLSKD